MQVPACYREIDKIEKSKPLLPEWNMCIHACNRNTGQSPYFIPQRPCAIWFLWIEGMEADNVTHQISNSMIINESVKRFLQLFELENIQSVKAGLQKFVKIKCYS